MTTEVEFLRDQVNRLNSVLGRYQDEFPPPSSVSQTVDVVMESAAPWISDRGLMAPLIEEYDRHIQQMEMQLKFYQKQMTDVKASLEQVVKENERLHAEQRMSIEKQLQSLSTGTGGDATADAIAISNLEEQVKCAVEEKERALQMWQTASHELDRLQTQYQSSISDGQIHAVERQHMQTQLVQVQQHSQKLQLTNQKLESTNQQFLKTVAEQSSELEELRSQLRQAKLEQRSSATKVEEMTRLLQNVQDQMQRREEDAAEAQGREEASDRRLQQLQAALKQLEARLKAATQDSESVRRKQTDWERQVGELQGRCSSLEEEKFEALSRLRNSIQLAEEASLQREQAQLREKQRAEELEKMKDAMKQLIQDAAMRTRKEVESVRKQCNVQIHRMAEELSALQLECADKETQIERAHRERKAVEEELEKVYKEGRVGEPEMRKMEALHQRCLNAERLKDEMQLTLNSTKNKMKKMEMEYSEELLRCQEEVRRLQSTLTSARQESTAISEERLTLQQENQQLHRDMEALRKECALAQRRAKQQVSSMQQELCVKEQGLESRLREMEESSKNSSAGLTRLLLAQQKTISRYKDEAKNLTQAFQQKLNSLRSELNRQKQRTQELEIQMEADHQKILEYERQVSEHQEKNTRLQRRLTQAEQRAASASQQLSVISQRRKAASMMDLETLS
ncbi:sodium channel and clathrin linker 1 [Cyprinus carpio]|uniref:Sodium channel and clathrin linker 1 n=3 Tax=Cyprinus carpio TaxID=7962 RepID=A0A9Q9VWZ3_CYPCA|nr:sodium channel and clathrin linker 1 [Cyprinus carpio]XP_042572729.1 sodium channel and clathrin linker 1 [Cyprinus carpio]